MLTMIVLSVSGEAAFEMYVLTLLLCLQKFFQKWRAKESMKDRTSALHHQTIWTTVAPKTSLNSLQQTWRTWRSITTLARIQAATLHLE